MRFYEKGLFLKLGLIFSLLHLILYLPVHLSYQDFMANAPEWIQVALGILVSLASQFVSFVLPLFGATVLFISYAYRGLAHAAPRVLILALPYLISALPENYLYFLIYFDSNGAIFFSAIFSLLTVLAVAIEMLVLFGVIVFFCRLPKDKRFDAAATAELERDEMLNFGNRFAKGALMASLLALLVRLITEIVTTVTYIISANGTYRSSEIVTVVATYVFIALMWVASYVLMYKSKTRIINYRLDEATEK